MQGKNDLRHVQGFLASVARGLEESELAPSDVELAELAARHADPPLQRTRLP